MDKKCDEKPTPKTRSTLFRQNVVQSNERSPLIGNEVREFSLDEPMKLYEQSDSQLENDQENLIENNRTHKKRRHPPPEPITTSDGRSFVTLHRGLLKKQGTSTVTNSFDNSFSIESPPDKNDFINITGENEKEKEESPKPIRDVTKGILLALFGAGVMYGLTGVFVRLAGENNVGAAETLFVRSAVQSIIFGSLAAYKNISFRPPEGRTKICVMISIAYSVATIASFEAFNVIPPGNAIATRGASRTVFAVLLAFLISREKIFTRDLAAVAICIGGISMIIGSSLTSNERSYIVPAGMKDNKVVVNIYGYTLIVLAGLTRSLGMVGVRKVKDELHSFTIVFYHSGLTFLAAIIFLLIRSSPWPPSAAGICYTLAVCVTSSIATWSSNYAVQLVHPALVSMSQNADLVVSIILEHTILNLVPQPLELLGAICILFGVSGLSWLKWKESKAEKS